MSFKECPSADVSAIEIQSQLHPSSTFQTLASVCFMRALASIQTHFGAKKMRTFCFNNRLKAASMDDFDLLLSVFQGR